MGRAIGGRIPVFFVRPKWRLATVLQLVYARIAMAERAYTNCNTVVHQLPYDEKTTSFCHIYALLQPGCKD